MSSDAKPVNPTDDPRFLEALRLYRAGDSVGAQQNCRIIVKADPKNRDALYLLAVLHSQAGDFTEAEHLFAQAIALRSDADAHFGRGYALQKLQRHAEALACFDKALAEQPPLAKAVLGRGLSLSNLGHHAEAAAAYSKAAKFEPRSADAWFFLGSAQLELKRDTDALASFDKTLAIKSDHSEAWRLRATALSRLDHPIDAVASLDNALRLHPNHVDAWTERASVLMRLNRHAEAADSYARALQLKPKDAALLYGRANALSILKRYPEAITLCETLLSFAPDHPYARGVLLHSKLQSCDWRSLAEERAKVSEAVTHGRHVVSPFNYKAISDSPASHLQCSRLMVADQYPPSAKPLWRGDIYCHKRMRLAYVSGDFNNTVVASLMAGVFEKHDRNHMEIFAISFGPNQPTEMRTRLEAAFEHFIDVRAKSDTEIAALLRELEIDIAVDLMGFTGECRTGIFAHRGVPLQINFLGYPGTMGAAYIDYLIADETVIPEEQRAFYDERIVYLPGCFLPWDSQRTISRHIPSRTAAGLPDNAFVFCSFNNSYKFNPEMFDIWMRLLRGAEHSVLWLASSNGITMRNLQREVEARGVSPSRLIFAPHVPLPEDHLARMSLADLFLDTLPYNAHATASDAILAGVPLLTCIGESFAGRVAASQLKAIGLPELIMESSEAYENLALDLAHEPERLKALRARLAHHRKTLSLFDITCFTRHLESAYFGVWERHRNGLPPASFHAGVQP